jgi:hypothetical protein
MIPQSFETFFLATAGTGGALIGLLFVAISLHPRRTFDPLVGAGVQDQRLAEAALLTLANGFVVSSIASIPGISVGWVALVLGAGGVLTEAIVGQRVARLHRHAAPWYASWRHLLHVVLLGLAATVLYAIQCLLGLHVLLGSADTSSFRRLALIIIGLYAVGLVRTWTLLGDPQYGWSGWLNPLQDIVASGEIAEPLVTHPGQTRVPDPRPDSGGAAVGADRLAGALRPRRPPGRPAGADPRRGRRGRIRDPTRPLARDAHRGDDIGA